MDKKVIDPEVKWISGILEKNKDKSFVKRVMERDKYPVLQNPDGTHSTHSMTWGESDGKYIVFPTVLLNEDGQLYRYDDRSAWEHTMTTGNFIEFDTPEDAERFSKNYKRFWGPEFK